MKPISVRQRSALVLLVTCGVILLNGCATSAFDPTATATLFPPNEVIYPTFAAQTPATPRPEYLFEQGTYLLEGSLVMLEPEHEEILTSLRPQFRVEPVPGAVGYEFQVDISPEFNSRIMQSSFIFSQGRVRVSNPEPEWVPHVNLNLTPDLFRTNEWGALSKTQIYEIVLRLIDGSSTHQEALAWLYDYVAYQIDVSSDEHVLPCDIALARTGNECGNQMEALGYIAYLLGYPVRKISIRLLDDWISMGTGEGHTTMEIFVGGKWQLMDPYVRFTIPGDSLLDLADRPPEKGLLLELIDPLLEKGSPSIRIDLDNINYPTLVSETHQIWYFPYLNSVYVLEPDWHASYSYEFSSYQAVPASFYDSYRISALITEYNAQPADWTPQHQHAMQENLVALWHPRQIPEPSRHQPFEQTYYWRVRAFMNPQVMNVSKPYLVEVGDVSAWSEVRTFTLEVTVPVLE